MPFKDPEAARAYRREYYHRPEVKKRVNAATRARRATPIGKAKEKAYTQKNSERHKAYCKEWYQQNKERLSKKGRENYQLNKEAILKQHKIYFLRYYAKNKERILAAGHKWLKENPERVKALRKKALEEMRDSVIVSYLVYPGQKQKHKAIPREEITPELIEARREMLIANRLVRKLKKEGYLEENYERNI